MIVRLYYANQLLQQWWRGNSSLSGISREIMEVLGREIYNGGYICCTPGNRYGTEWYRCDFIPVRQEEVPKELLVLELLNPP